MNFIPKILIAEPGDFSPKAISLLQQSANVTILPISENDLIESFNNYDVFWMRLGFRINDKVLSDGVRCKIIVTPVTGTDHIDEDICKRLGIEVISLKGEVDFLKEVRATAELTVGMAIALMRNIIPAYSSVMNGNWARDEFRGNELYGKKIGIVGMGRLGKIVAGYFKAFGLEVIGYDKITDFPEGIAKVDSLKDLMMASDIVSIHVNLTEETKKLFGEEEFSYFKEGSYFINTSRGDLIDEKALLNALKYGRLAGAALDVISNEEDITKDNPLIQYARHNSNLVILPHIGGNTYESFAKTEMFLAKKLVEKMEDIF